ncbi:MAG: hypothetical protein JNL83_04525 [Myxococcales bacterium]|nr:hypothetical protein [Myxococcales bacterium]
MTRICLLVLLALAAGAGRARADEPPLGAVALLPLDADARLAIYGQPVASEIARALVAGGIDVVVVGPRMAVPDRAWLVVDGTIAGKGDAVVLSLRVRNPVDGAILPTKPTATAQGLPNIDKAAVELSAALLPVVRDELRRISAATVATTKQGAPVQRPNVAVVKPDAPRPLVLALAPNGDPLLRDALAAAAKPWAAKRNDAIADAGPGLQLALVVKRYAATNDAIPYARARVRAKITNGGTVLFDRVVVTDSVLGDKGIAPAALATRTAREVLDILRPHMRRAVAGWR